MGNETAKDDYCQFSQYLTPFCRRMVSEVERMPLMPLTGRRLTFDCSGACDGVQEKTPDASGCNRGENCRKRIKEKLMRCSFDVFIIASGAGRNNQQCGGLLMINQHLMTPLSV
jgi:hypothetical protein